jgi:nucleoside-diphosphate-sugar epimerase
MNIDKKEKILITGGGGFLGFYIVKLLLKNNYSVVSFSRSKYNYLEELNVPQICGDLTQRDDIKNALEGIDAVIHTASKVGMHGRYEDFYQSNYVGTKNLVDAMKLLKINKLVYTSTPSVVFGKNDLINADETTPYPDSYLTYYAETKMLAERYVLNNVDQSFMAVSLRPHLIFGPGDQNLVPRVLEAKKKNKLKIIGNGDNLVDVIYVENAALAHLLALKNLNPLISGNSYFIGQGPINLWTFTNKILEHYKLEKIEKKIPLWLAYSIGSIIEITLKIFQLHQIHPPMSRFIALQLGKSHYFKHDKALRDLGNFIEFSIPEGIQKLQ